MLTGTTRIISKAVRTNRAIFITGFVLILVTGRCLIHAETSAKLIRVFEPASDLADISDDGKLILAVETQKRKCADKKNVCLSEVLVVYETSTGKKLGELENRDKKWGLFSAASFVREDIVGAFENSRSVWIEWNFENGLIQEKKILFEPESQVVCFTSDKRLLLKKRVGPLEKLSTLDPVSLSAESIQQSVLPIGHFDCKGWKRASSYLLETETEKHRISLSLISSKPEVLSQGCQIVPNEETYNHTVSPDGSIIAIITGIGGQGTVMDDVLGPEDKTFLNLFDGSTCGRNKRFELQFPEQPKLKAPLLAPKNKYYANARLKTMFAKRLAISPDNSKLAIGYGIRTGGIYSDSIAYYGIYSMQDGHRIITLKADSYKFSNWEALFSDMAPMWWAPLDGILRFGPDSKKLFAGSKRIWQWDLSPF